MSVDQPRPTRRMTDMGPRRMDGFARPGAAGGRPAGTGRPAAQPQVERPTPPRPMPARPVRPADARPVRPETTSPRRLDRPAQPEAQIKPAARKGGGWKVMLQFVIGLAVIAGVATAIVWLYIKYYQQ